MALQGEPRRFTPGQVGQIITLACRAPADFAVPLTHGTPTAIAREAIAPKGKPDRVPV